MSRYLGLLLANSNEIVAQPQMNTKIFGLICFPEHVSSEDLVPQTIYAKLIGLHQSPRLLPLDSPLIRQGSFPPPALPGFISITGPSAICLSRPRPSRASRCHRHAFRPAPRQTSLFAHQSSRVRAVTTTPAEWSGRISLACLTTAAFPRHYGGSASAAIFSGPARCSLSLRSTRYTSLLTEEFS